MDDEQKPEVRRVGSKDRKEQLDPVEPVLPQFDDDDPLAALAAEVVPGERLSFPPSASRHRATPPEERFPPLATDDAESAPSAPMSAVRRRQKIRAKRGHGDWRHNLVALLFLFMTFGLCGYIAILWQNPYSPLNPLAPPTPFVIVSETPDVIAIATYEANLTQIAAQPSAFPTVAPSVTSASVLLPTGEEDTPEVVPATLARVSSATFALQEPGVTYRENDNDRGCNWASIEGQVLSVGGLPLGGYSIRMIDAERPELFDVTVFSGANDGRFEQLLGSSPREQNYTVQLYDLANLPVSDPVLVTTQDSCDSNVAIVTFVEIP